VLREQVVHKLRRVRRGALLTHFHITQPGMGCEGEQDTAGAMFLLFIMGAWGFPRTHGQDGAPLANEETRPLITTDQWSQRIIRQGLLEEHVFHMPHITPRHLPDAPLGHSPGLRFTFFNIPRTLSCEMVGTASSLTRWSAIRCSVQRAAPWGGAEHASMVTWASTVLSNFMGRPARGSSRKTSKIGCSPLW
jgi:hypothetical protein